MRFQDLHLSEPLLRAVEEKGYTTPTPIQTQAIPPVLQGRDLQGCAQTGTGKTAAFTLPILQLLAAEPAPKGRRPIRALVLTPTRELAIQIDECCRDYARYTTLRHTVIFGGVNQRPQVDALQRGVDLLVATPGRLLDLIGQGFVSLDRVRHFVLDEADRMLDMGFIHDIRRILPLLPERKQTLFFSATMPDSIASLAASLLHDPARVTVTPPASVVETIGQQVRFVAKAEKSKQLVALLNDSDAEAVLVFSRTKHGADRLARILNKAGIACSAIHGDKSQGAREKAMNGFKSGACRVLIATDIAARGIDISELPLVVNYELPEVPETYVHRIGRTGRAGCEGNAYSFCAEEEIPLLRDIEKTIGRPVPVDPAAELPEWAAAAFAPAARSGAAKRTASAGAAKTERGTTKPAGRSTAKPDGRGAAGQTDGQIKQAGRSENNRGTTPKANRGEIGQSGRSENRPSARTAKSARSEAATRTGQNDRTGSRQTAATVPAEQSATPSRSHRAGRNRKRSGAANAEAAPQQPARKQDTPRKQVTRNQDTRKQDTRNQDTSREQNARPARSDRKRSAPAAPAPEPAPVPKRHWWQFGRS